jgi:hypothetical protein
LKNLGIGGTIGYKRIIKNRAGERGFDLFENRERWPACIYGKVPSAFVKRGKVFHQLRE